MNWLTRSRGIISWIWRENCRVFGIDREDVEVGNDGLQTALSLQEQDSRRILVDSEASWAKDSLRKNRRHDGKSVESRQMNSKFVVDEEKNYSIRNRLLTLLVSWSKTRFQFQLQACFNDLLLVYLVLGCILGVFCFVVGYEGWFRGWDI